MVIGPPLAQFEPPFFVFDVGALRSRFRAFEAAFRARFASVVIGYSYKTNYLPALCRVLHELGAHAEVVSRLELTLAERLGVPSDWIIYNGPAKRHEDIVYALDLGCRLNLDSVTELESAAQYASQKPANEIAIGLRITPKRARPQDQPCSRFGIDLEGPALQRTLEILAGVPNLRVRGLQVHYSDRERGVGALADNCETIVGAHHLLSLGKIDYIDVGGGFGYAPPSMRGALQFPTDDEYAQAIADALPHSLVAGATVIAEPGISLAGSAMSFFAPVRAIKVDRGRLLAVVDGGIHNVRPTKHRVPLPVTALDASFHVKSGPLRVYDVVGYTCMEDDFLAARCELPELQVGDVLQFDQVGAYTIVFTPPFIRPAPSIVAVDGDRAAVVRREQRFEDIFSGYEH